MRVIVRREARGRERRVVRERAVMGVRVVPRRPARGPVVISTGVPMGRVVPLLFVGDWEERVEVADGESGEEKGEG